MEVTKKTKVKAKKPAKKKSTLERKLEIEAYFESRKKLTKEEAMESSMIKDEKLMAMMKEYNQIKEAEHEEWLRNAYMSQKVDLNQLHKVMGLQGLYTIASAKQKSGMVGVRRFGGEYETKTVKATDLISLGFYKFYLEGGEKITLAKVLDNIEEYHKNIVLKARDKSSSFSIPSDIMDIAVPGYDPEEFKSYHMELVLKFYHEIKEALKDE